jgi:hypothetical protein
MNLWNIINQSITAKIEQEIKKSVSVQILPMNSVMHVV